MKNYRIDVVSKRTAENILPEEISAMIDIQNDWYAGKGTVDPEKGFLVTVFSDKEIKDLFESGATFFF